MISHIDYTFQGTRLRFSDNKYYILTITLIFYANVHKIAIYYDLYA